eukprot:TRINITY_DN7261_c0_g2_i4.p1 TRINITY_DN7261_c0_g2~~TRINITY_DN7261_c0_g2_i4.p1  ORF type:complete len:151 (-),score=4.87 TRINITY_DN7261_c0_g2_i4:1093-1545(-)
MVKSATDPLLTDYKIPNPPPIRLPSDRIRFMDRRIFCAALIHKPHNPQHLRFVLNPLPCISWPPHAHTVDSWIFSNLFLYLFHIPVSGRSILPGGAHLDLGLPSFLLFILLHTSVTEEMESHLFTSSALPFAFPLAEMPHEKDSINFSSC